MAIFRTCTKQYHNYSFLGVGAISCVQEYRIAIPRFQLDGVASGGFYDVALRFLHGIADTMHDSQIGF